MNEPVTLSSWLNSPLRRAFDLLAAGALLVVAAPVITLAALAVRLESRGHPIYRQLRVGLDGHAFEVLKLRTMVSGAENLGAGLAVDADDARITRVGALLRRTSIDELPNLVNVLRGEMAVIGPRPTVQIQIDRYTDRQRERLRVRPGITGWAQVNGRASLPWSERIELDSALPGERLARARREDPRGIPAHGADGPRPLPRRDRRLARVTPTRV